MLGEGARAVLEVVADEAAVPPTRKLRRDDPSYGEPDRLLLGDYNAQWYALTHPGNRNAEWKLLQQRWQERTRGRAGP